MGYYTTFRLSIELVDGKQLTKQESDTFKAELLVKYEASEHYDQDGYLAYMLEKYPDSSKWYDHEDDMREFSKLYPNVVFRLEGEGEEAGDVWCKFFQNGKMQDATPPTPEFYPFDPDKLT
jgi:hypothetical protein